MNKKQQRIKMLVELDNSLADIGRNAEDQTPEIIGSNMIILRDQVKAILKLDGIQALKTHG